MYQQHQSSTMVALWQLYGRLMYGVTMLQMFPVKAKSFADLLRHLISTSLLNAGYSMLPVTDRFSIQVTSDPSKHLSNIPVHHKNSEKIIQILHDYYQLRHHSTTLLSKCKYPASSFTLYIQSQPFIIIIKQVRSISLILCFTRLPDYFINAQA